MKKFGLISVFIIQLGLQSCITLEDKSTKDYLTDGIWNGDTYRILLSDGTVYDMGGLNATFEFKTNGRYRYDSSTDGIHQTGDWELQNDDKEIYLEADDGTTGTMYIDHLDDENLHVHVLNSGMRAEYTFTQD